MYKVIEGYPNYSVSDSGQVMNNKTGRILKTYAHKDGYRAVKLYHNRKNKTLLVHRLVALAFIPNPCNYPQINHKDENTSNNCVENLEWCTGKYNCNYGGHNQRLRETLCRVQPWLGRKHSLETRLKISKIKKGFKHTEESKQKLSEKLKGRPKPKDFGEKLSRAKGFKVILDESIVFNSITKCGLYLGTHGASIVDAITKKDGVYKGHTIRRLGEENVI